MAVVDKTFERMLEETGSGEWVKYDVLSSLVTPELFHKIKHVLPNEIVAEHSFETLPPEEKSPTYRMQDNWQETWTVVRYVALKTEYLVDLAGAVGLTHGRLPMIPVGELYYNAFMWGNGFDATRPVSVKVFKGTEGALLRMRDDGTGFDLQELLAKRARKEKYATRAGKGFMNFCGDQHYELAYEGGGSIANMRVIRARNREAEPQAAGGAHR